jgi:hypothetical protein
VSKARGNSNCIRGNTHDNAIAELQGGQNLKNPGGLHTATFYHPVAGATMANHETFTLNTLVSTPPAPPPPPPPPLPRMLVRLRKARALRRSLRHRAGGRSETQLCATGR